MKDATITVDDGRTVGFADFGSPSDTAVVWCHGGPGSRLEPGLVADAAAGAGLRLIGIDRPGYGRSTPQPARTIAGWVPDALAVLNQLGIDQCAAVGVSTGGAYALALAACSTRVIGVVTCCAVSDMAWTEGKAMNVCCHPAWSGRDRHEAFAISREIYGEHGEKMLPPNDPMADAPDRALFARPEFQTWWASYVPDMFASGVTGCVDDRLADGNGWGTFDITRITCPVTVLHGADDGLMPVANAYHTAAIVPGATVRIVENAGHLSVIPNVIEVVSELLKTVPHANRAI